MVKKFLMSDFKRLNGKQKGLVLIISIGLLLSLSREIANLAILALTTAGVAVIIRKMLSIIISIKNYNITALGKIYIGFLILSVFWKFGALRPVHDTVMNVLLTSVGLFFLASLVLNFIHWICEEGI